MSENNQKKAPKTFTTIKEQIEKLKSYGLLPNKKEQNDAERILKKVKYYFLMDACGKIFQKDGKRREYIEGTKISHLYSCYKFDCDLKAAALAAIQQVEQRVNTLAIHYFAKRYQKEDDVEFYLNRNNYFQSRGDDFIRGLEEEIKAKGRVEFHGYTKENQNIPLWIIANSFSFGLTCRLYYALEQSVQKQICAEFGIVSTEELDKLLWVLNDFRNICAHSYTTLFDGEEVNKEFSQEFIKNAQTFKWIMENNNKRYDFYVLMMILAQLLEFDDWVALEKKARELLSGLKNTLRDVPEAYRQVEAKMGLSGKSDKWAKKILNWLTFRIKNAEDWYDNVLIDTIEGESIPAGEILESKLIALQEDIQIWMKDSWNKKNEYDEKFNKRNKTKRK